MSLELLILWYFIINGLICLYTIYDEENNSKYYMSNHNLVKFISILFLFGGILYLVLWIEELFK